MFYTRWGDKGQLILEIHWYPGAGFNNTTLPGFIEIAKKVAGNISSRVPIFLGEFDRGLSPQMYADALALATSSGCNASTYWLYGPVWTEAEWNNYQPGMYMYSDEVLQNGPPFTMNDSQNVINFKSWPAYQKSVADGTSWGAWITGAGGAANGVLELMPADAPKQAETQK
eukprot:TRINITY_DN6298_c0_g1_i1.p2 TRINITY_DN6298_c0_g1~~TRINITY_DN6298_c0_g1_i1.p2  ORF type:complete len:171 (-),score=28.54 TRINITY_DN6298_c0_g1_i1:619-1131(-)